MNCSFARVDSQRTDGLAYGRRMCFGDGERVISCPRGVMAAGAAMRCGATPTPREPDHDWSRHGRRPASFRHQSGIRFRNIRELPSHFLFARAQLCEPGDNTNPGGFVTRVWGTDRSQGSQGTGMAVNKGISVGWEAW